MDDGLRSIFKAVYHEVDVQPHSPPWASVMEVESPFAGVESKLMSTQFSDVRHLDLQSQQHIRHSMNPSQ